MINLNERNVLKIRNIITGCAAALLLVSTSTSAALAGDEDSAFADNVPVITEEIEGAEQIDGKVTFESDQTQLTVLPSTAPEPTAAELAAKARYITCNLNVENVHPSAHVSGTINGVAKITCDAAAGSLTLHYSLIRVSPNNKQWAAPSKSNAGKKTIQNNKGVPCSNGPAKFQGWAQGQLTPPAGYQVLGDATSNKWGKTLQVACGGAKRAAVETPENAETLTVTFVRNDISE
ncbi:hypothetical protein [Leucobacter luti]|uniref:hypothetical protein n=1 Tax=Leucobacter luti TaxID=340320 RepID=UPI001C68AA2B|nr:hypothetical protein [Leucobacter luti]QYM76184.1 hypothetical protein K1X41_01455 [Leucobacter luti]